jgi:hypothetical protein
MHDPADNAKPIGCREEMRLDVPIASDDPRAFEGLDAYGSLLQDEQVGFREPFAVLEVYAQDVNTSFANAPNPRGLQTVPELIGNGNARNGGDADALPGQDGVAA